MSQRTEYRRIAEQYSGGGHKRNYPTNRQYRKANNDQKIKVKKKLFV